MGSIEGPGCAGSVAWAAYCVGRKKLGVLVEGALATVCDDSGIDEGFDIDVELP